MADRTLSFASSFTVTVNGTQVTSPYTLTENCTIVATNPSGDTAALYVNGQTWSYVGSSITITDQNIALSREGKEEPAIDPPSLTINYIASQSVPTPDWANCFVKTSSGNKAVEKVLIKQRSSLNVVWEAPAVTHKLFASEDMANNGGELSLFINGKSYDLKGNSTDYVEIKTGDVIEGSAFISHNEFMALALKGVDTETIYAQGNGGTDGAYLDVSYTVPSTLTEDLIFVEVNA